MAEASLLVLVVDVDAAAAVAVEGTQEACPLAEGGWQEVHKTGGVHQGKHQGMCLLASSPAAAGATGRASCCGTTAAAAAPASCAAAHAAGAAAPFDGAVPTVNQVMSRPDQSMNEDLAVAIQSVLLLL